VPAIDIAPRPEERALLGKMAGEIERLLGMPAERLASGNPDLREIRPKRPAKEVMAAVRRDNQHQDCDRLKREEQRGIDAQALRGEP
jgi:hypothetical protein